MRLLIALCVISMGCSNSSFSGGGEKSRAKTKGSEIKTADAIDDRDNNDDIIEEDAVQKDAAEGDAVKEDEEPDYSPEELSKNAPGCGIPVMYEVPFFGRTPNLVGGYPTSHPVLPSDFWFRHIFSSFEHESYNHIFERFPSEAFTGRVGRGFLAYPSRTNDNVWNPKLANSVFKFSRTFLGIPSGVKITVKTKTQEVLFTATGPLVVRFIDHTGLSEEQINAWSSQDMMDSLQQTILNITDDPLKLPKWLEGLNGKADRFVVKRIDNSKAHSLKISLLDRAQCDVD